MARILLVGGDDANRSAAKEAIQDPGTHEIIEVRDGPGALAALQRRRFDVVVLDVKQLEEIASEVSIERDALRETFDVFDEALLLLDAAGRPQIENAAGRKLLERLAAAVGGAGAESIRADIAELARDAVARKTVCDRGMSHG